MQSFKTLALLSVAVPCFALALSGSALAQSTIGSPSTPVEKTQTQTLNQNITDANTAAVAQSNADEAQYQAQQQRYQEQLVTYRSRQQNYVERSGRYLASRDRYIAAHARYHRDIWPVSYEHRIIVTTDDLLGARVETSNGRTVGHVEELSLFGGHVAALRVILNDGRGDIWVEAADMRFDAGRKVVMTNLDRHDLYEMTHDSF